MSFIRVKTIKNRRYLYRQTSVREGKKVRSIMEYLGAVDRQDRALATAERMAGEMDAYQRSTFGETGQERADREKQEGQFDQAEFLVDTQEAAAKDGKK